MIDILLYLNEYVPCQSQIAVDKVTQKEVSHDAIHEILLGGDQLTRKRVESSKEGRKNDTSLATKLKGFIPVNEDWHAKKIFVTVSNIITFTELMYFMFFPSDDLEMAIQY